MQNHSSANAPQLQSVSREAFWQRHVRQWRDSGLSKMAYAQQYALVYHQLVYWCSKASKASKVTDDTVEAPCGFVPVTVTPPFGDAGLSVRLPNGIAIEGIDERSVALVGQLIEQL